MRWALTLLITGVILLVAPGFLESEQADHSVVTRPAPSSTVVATAEPSGDAVATTASRPSQPPRKEQVATTPEPSTPEEVAQAPEAGKLPADGAIPTEVSIGSASIRNTELMAAGLSSEGIINPPPSTVMWFDDDKYGNVVPGQLGTGIIAGHVVYSGVPDVFHQLEQVRPGDEVRLDYSDGSHLELVIVSAEIIGKDELTGDRRLWQEQRDVQRVVIITCSDEQGYLPNGHRVANYVVIAEPAA